MDVWNYGMLCSSFTLPSGHVINIRSDMWVADFIKEEVYSLLLGLDAPDFHDDL